MKAKIFYKICIGICLFIFLLICSELYETNYLKGDKTYLATITDKYIGSSGGWKVEIVKFKFNWNNDSIIEEASGSNSASSILKINDTISIYYNPKASATKIIVAKTLKEENNGFFKGIAGLIVLIFFLIYKIYKDKNEVLFYNPDKVLTY